MMMKVEQPPAHHLLQLEALILSLPITSPKLPPRDKVVDQASEEVVDIDDLFLPKRQCIAMMGWPRGSARHDGRLPLQVLGDIGVVDLVKRHHLWSHLLVQNDVVVVGQEHGSK